MALNRLTTSLHSRALGVALAACAATLPAQDDRENGTPTGALVVSGVDLAYLQARVNEGFRLTDLEVENLSPRRYGATMVQNSGSYARGWWWLIDVTPTQLGDFVSQNQARIIDLEPYLVGGALRFAAVMVHNAGAQAKSWWWYYGQTANGLLSLANQHNARLVDVDVYQSGNSTLRSGVMIANTGSDSRAWSYYANVSTATISNAIQQTGRRVYDLEPASSSTFDAVLTQTTGVKWWWYYGQTLGEVGARAAQLGARVVDIERREVQSGVFRYDVVYTNNSNALTTRLGETLRAGTDGNTGVYLKRVNGPVLAALMADHVMDPASVLKTVHLIRAMRYVQMGWLDLDGTVNVWDGCGPTCCPTRTNPDTETLRTTLQKMMRNSDNQSTLSVTDLVGSLATLDATANSVGATSTHFNHHIGCGLPANETTLADIGRMHEAVRNGYLGAWGDDFYGIMSRWNGGGYLDTLLSQEAANVGLSASQLAAFRSRIVWNSKGGSYDLPGGVYQRATGASVTLPFQSNGGIVDVAYVSGVFVDGASYVPAGTLLSEVHAEAYREEIRAAMLTWRNHVAGSFTTFGVGCAGSAGTPQHSAQGTPELGQSISYDLDAAPAGTTVVLNLGLSRTAWNRLPLPFALNALGAPGCFLNVGPIDSASTRTGRGGTASIPLAIPLSQSLIGADLFTQFLVVDPRANAAGLTTTNGLTTHIGGLPTGR
ncbi:MAG: serine hydrolase [Planctomycetes bacterium]|nr:serine hydrolase [Planctomycetota bacterium]